MQAKGHQRHVLQGRWGNDSRKPEKEMAVFRRIELKTGLQWRVSAFRSEYGIGREASALECDAERHIQPHTYSAMK